MCIHLMYHDVAALHTYMYSITVVLYTYIQFYIPVYIILLCKCVVILWHCIQGGEIYAEISTTRCSLIYVRIYLMCHNIVIPLLHYALYKWLCIYIECIITLWQDRYGLLPISNSLNIFLKVNHGWNVHQIYLLNLKWYEIVEALQP